MAGWWIDTFTNYSEKILNNFVEKLVIQNEFALNISNPELCLVILHNVLKCLMTPHLGEWLMKNNAFQLHSASCFHQHFQFRGWLEKNPSTLQLFIFTFIRVIEDHDGARFKALRQNEVEFCIQLIRDRVRNILNCNSLIRNSPSRSCRFVNFINRTQ